ncbi:MAG TPA: hypothetical protein VN947_26115 [Polyangia bacterium]|nr:hypothetical protein [Polyangia bacterium]
MCRAATCDDDVLTKRLRRRPAWRRSGGEQYIADHVAFNRWFKDEGASATPPVDLLDTTHETVEETSTQVARWIRARLGAPSGGAARR